SRQGVGRMILELCEAAAAAEGFGRLELMGTLAGQPLYTAYGFVAAEVVEDSRGGVAVPLVRMEKSMCRCERTLSRSVRSGWGVHVSTWPGALASYSNMCLNKALFETRLGRRHRGGGGRDASDRGVRSRGLRCPQGRRGRGPGV